MSGSFPPGFQWDEDKNRINLREHKIAFADAVRIFEKPTLDEIDTRENYYEERTNSLGELNGRIILNVTHTERSGEIRLISARPATSREKELYREFVRDLGLSAKEIADQIMGVGREHGRKQPEPMPEIKNDPAPTIGPDFSRGMELRRKRPPDEDGG